MKLSQRRTGSFQHKIFSWWTTHKRDLPWRHTRNPYKIMVSEVMLQQTKVFRVLTKYTEFIEVFPTVRELADATPADVLRIWKGMGYNRRALYLHKTAKAIVEIYHGIFPANERELVKLPGLGKYTARALLVFAYGQDVPLVDTNIRQIITHFFFKDQPQKESVIEDIAGQLVPKGKSWEWHQALMDYGALELQKVYGKRQKVKKKLIPFRDSNRFYLGRIVDRLREGSVSEKELLKEFTKRYGKPKVFFGAIIASLLSDGLIERVKRGTLQLPEA